MSPTALLQCQYPAWYPRYAALAAPSAIIPLPPDFAARVLLQHAAAPPGAAAAAGSYDSSSDDGAGDDASSGGDGSVRGSSGDGASSSSGGAAAAAAASAEWAEQFPDLHAAIDAAIAQLGGAVAPKLNWSSPLDAAAGGAGLRCTSAGQVVALLRRSRRAAFDLELAAQLGAGGGGGAPGPCLVLRSWVELSPAHEFRLFVSDHRPAAVCQRDPARFHPELQEEGVQRRLRDAVCEFHAENFGGFPRGACESVVGLAGPLGGPRLS
jgi:hypothetical protein